MVHAWKRKGEKHHEAFLGIVYDGKEKLGGKRRRLRNKIAACGLEGSEQFGQDLFVAAQKNHPDVGTSKGPGVPAMSLTQS